MEKTLKSPLRWIGGKAKLVKKILPLLPEHETYVEVFAGGASLLFAKDISKIEVINDLNSGIVNFFRVLRNPEMFKKFQALISLMPYSREEYLNCRDTWMHSEDDVERAVRWFMVVRQCLGGVFGSGFGTSVTSGNHGMATNVAGYLRAVNRLPETAARLRMVQIEHRDFRKILKQYDRPKTLFYLDPPYVGMTRKSKKVYEHEMTDQEHEEWVEMATNMKGKVVISGYENPIYRPLETAGFKRHDFRTTCHVAGRTSKTGLLGAGSATENQERTESLWIKN